MTKTYTTQIKTAPDTGEVMTARDLYCREEYDGLVRLTYQRDGRQYTQDVLPAYGCAPYVTPLVRLQGCAPRPSAPQILHDDGSDCDDCTYDKPCRNATREP